MKKWLTLLLVLGIVFLSGCDGAGGSGGSPSVSINNFGPLTIGTSGNPVRNGRLVTLSAIFKNEGGAPVEGGSAKIVGLGNDWIFEGGNREISFNIRPGQEVRRIWKITAPETSEFEMDITYPVEVRYEFPYGTVFRGTFSWLSSGSYDELLNTAEQAYIEETLKNKGFTVSTTSKGPVSIDLQELEVIGNPEVLIKFNNRGGGRLVGSSIDIESVRGLNCPDLGGSIELINNAYETYCTVNTGTDDDVSVDIEIRISYDYYVSDKSNIYYHDTGRTRT